MLNTFLKLVSDLYQEFISIVLFVLSAFLLALSLYLLKKSYRIYRLITRGELEKGRVKKLRKRYVVFAALCENKVEYNDVNNAIKEAFVKLYGEVTAQKASPRLLLFDEERQRGVVRVLHLYTDHFIALLGYIRRIGNTNCILIPLKVTGTVKKARRYLDAIKL